MATDDPYPTPPAWMPPLVVAPSGTAADHLELAYPFFQADFLGTGKPNFRGLGVGVLPMPAVDGKDATFMHLVQQDAVGKASRLYCPRRTERIRWAKAVIEAPRSEVLCWRVLRTTSNARNQDRVVIALKDFSYVVVLANREHYWLLWTAYPVEFKSRRAKLEKELQAAGPL